jgi:hypothetical protein
MMDLAALLLSALLALAPMNTGIGTYFIVVFVIQPISRKDPKIISRKESDRPAALLLCGLA